MECHDVQVGQQPQEAQEKTLTHQEDANLEDDVGQDTSNEDSSKTEVIQANENATTAMEGADLECQGKQEGNSPSPPSPSHIGQDGNLQEFERGEKEEEEGVPHESCVEKQVLGASPIQQHHDVDTDDEELVVDVEGLSSKSACVTF